MVTQTLVEPEVGPLERGRSGGSQGREGGSSFGPDPGHAAIELRHLRYFVGLAEELHFGRAAERLYISQPGLSQAVARLEQVLGVKLFTRTRRKVELTQAGAELHGRARHLLAEHDDVIRRVRSVGRDEVALVRLGVALLSDALVAPALKAFHHEHPRIALDHSAMLSERLLEQLQIGGLQAAIVHQIPALAAAENVEWEPLRRDRLAVMVSLESPIAQAEVIRLDELRDETFLINPPAVAPGAYEGLKLMCREFGGFDAKVLESTALSTFVPGSEGCPLESGAAIVVVPEATARIVPAPGLAVVPIQPPPQAVVALAWRRGEPAPQVQRFIDYLRAYRDRHAWTARPDGSGAAVSNEPAPGRWRSG